MIPDKEIMKQELKKMWYIKVDSPVRTWFGGKVIGFNVSAPSLLRKAYTISRLQEVISEKNLPLIVDDTTGDATDSFRVMFKFSE